MSIKLHKWKGLVIVPSFFAYIFIVISSNSAFAIEEKKLLTLSKHPTWKSLLRYETHLLTPWSNTSIIRDKDFFFSSFGKEDPLKELKATLKAFNKPFNNKAMDEHPLCRFPARYKWLQKKLSIKNNDHQLKRCHKYQQWMSHGDISSISLIFATGYFGNPASFFGHPLLKFNIKGQKNNFTDSSINYGALTPDNENPFLYVLKGLAGGYNASFTRHEYFFHSHNYTETELRDLWDYKLNLTPEEIQYIVDRTWELHGKKHPYYFLVDNCASRMGQLLEEIYQKPLFTRNRLYVIPIDVYDNLEKGTRTDGTPMVSSIAYIPSRHSKLTKIYKMLNSQEQYWVKSIIKDNNDLSHQDFKKLGANNRTRVLETLINYFSFQKLKDKTNHEIEISRLAMIKERFILPQKSSFSKIDYNKKRGPHDSVNSLGIGVTHASGRILKNFQEFTIRPALYDELNPAPARPINTALEVFKTKFRYHDSSWSLRSLDIFNISTLNTSRTDLPNTGNMPWKMKLGLKSQSQQCMNCLVSFVEGGAGLAFNLTQDISFHALAKAGYQENQSDQGTAYILPELGSYIQLSKYFKMYLGYEYEKFVNGKGEEHNIWTVDSRLGSSQSWDLRFSYKKHDDEQALATLWFYL